jgi:integrase
MDMKKEGIEVGGFNLYLKLQKLSFNTMEQYLIQGRNFLLKNGYTSTKELAGLDDNTLLKMAKVFCSESEVKEEKETYTRTYIRRYVIKHLFLYMGREELVRRFMTETKKQYRQASRIKDIKTISYDNFKILLDELPSELSLIIKCQFELGARISEILSLRKCNLKEDGSIIKIVSKGKGDKPFTGELTESTSILLMKHWNSQEHNKNDKIKNEELIFNIKYSVFEHQLRTIAIKTIGVPYTSHMTKHMKADYLKNVLGMDLLDVSKELHHSSIETTTKYFSGESQHQKEIRKTLDKSPLY